MALHGEPPKGLLNRPQKGVAPEAGYQGETNVSPEEQQEYDKFMDNGFKLIYDERSMPQLLQRLNQSGNPVEGLATVTVGVVRRLVDAAEKAGQKIDPAVLLHGGADLMADIAALAKTAGVHEYSEEEIESASFVAMDQFGTAEIERGAVDQQLVADDFQALTQADQQGRLGEIIPGVESMGR